MVVSRGGGRKALHGAVRELRKETMYRSKLNQQWLCGDYVVELSPRFFKI